MRWRLVALLILTGAPALAGILAPHLIPIDREYSAFASSPAHRAYHVAVRDALVGRRAKSGCEAIVLPSFEREWAVHVRSAPRWTPEKRPFVDGSKPAISGAG